VQRRSISSSRLHAAFTTSMASASVTGLSPSKVHFTVVRWPHSRQRARQGVSKDCPDSRRFPDKVPLGAFRALEKTITERTSRRVLRMTPCAGSQSLRRIGFSSFAGGVTGPLLAYEVMTAFFLEAGFLGIMLFGWNRVGRAPHFISTALVATGTNISMFWILASNSWMQTPQGIKIVNGRVVPVDWIKIIFNPSFSYRFIHMALAAFIAAALVVAATGAWHLLRGRRDPAVRTMFSMAIGLLMIITPLQILAGDAHGLNTRKYQPAQITAIEGIWRPSTVARHSICSASLTQRPKQRVIAYRYRTSAA
jgi:hypothetical protein